MRIVYVLIGLLVISILAGIIRKIRGAPFLPMRTIVDDEVEPQSLQEMVERRRTEKLPGKPQ